MKGDAMNTDKMKKVIEDNIQRFYSEYGSNSLSYQELPIMAQYIIIKQNEEIIKLLKELKK